LLQNQAATTGTPKIGRNAAISLTSGMPWFAQPLCPL
jgi:hypothetical protein